MQTQDYLAGNEIFTDDYAYFSSTSASWLAHARAFVLAAAERFDLGRNSMVMEVAANDGYLLRYVKELNVPCLGIEPTASTAAVGRALGLNMLERFLGLESANEITTEFGHADLVIANNVLAHVPDLDDFICGLKKLMKPSGVLCVEFPRVTSLITGKQFDTIYHEHYSYLSLTSVRNALNLRGLEVFDLEEIQTHGGSLRIYAQRVDSGSNVVTERVEEIMRFESSQGITTLAYYENLKTQACEIKNDLWQFLIESNKLGKTIAAYGAAAKGNTLLNFAGIRPDLIKFVVDRSPSKIGKFLPGSRIPIVDETTLRESKPDYILILPWNIKGEVVSQLGYAREWGAQFVTAVPNMGIE